MPYRLMLPLVTVAVVVIATVVDRQPVRGLPAAVSTWLAVWVAICIQALPFLALGVVVSGAVSAFVSPTALKAILPRSPAGAVVAAGISGVVLPGCVSVPPSRCRMR
jgi:uncharacterized membrane protein YraQ (UPF0718 family)